MSAANGGVIGNKCLINPMPEAYVDGLILFVLSGLQLNLTTRMVANQTINIKESFWRQVEMRNLTYD